MDLADNKIAGVVLAAGLSTRFGADKLNAPLNGSPLASWALEAARASTLHEIVIVTRPELADTLSEAFDGVRMVFNEQAAEGQATSLRQGVAALGPEVSHALFLLADQPLLTPELIDSFVAAATTGHDLAALAGEGRLTPPTLFGRRFFPDLLQATGDAGGRGILAAHEDEVLALSPNFPLAGLDVDRPTDLTRASMTLGSGFSQAFGLGQRELIGVSGAGGKTGLIHALASEAALRGEPVLATTTTKVFVPVGRLLIEQEPSALLTLAAERTLPGWVLNLASDQGVFKGRTKLIGLDPALVDELWAQQIAPMVLVETDGARRLSLKAPRSHEPVVPPATTTLVGVMGLRTLGRPADSATIYGLEEFLAITGATPGQPIGPQHCAALALHPEGLFKGAPPQARKVVFLNQADAPGAPEAGREIAELLREKDNSLRVVLASLKQGWAEVLATG